MNVRERQVADALAARERQVAVAQRIERLLEDRPTHHGYAVDVKNHRQFCACEEPWESGCACGFERAREMFWDGCEHLACEHGFEGVHGAGRMGGYVVPYPQPRTDDMWPDEVDEWERDTFGPFMVDVLDALADAQAAWERGELPDGSPADEADPYYFS